MKELLTMENVSLIYHSPKEETTALSSVSFSVFEGESVVIIGPSGCGKTTVLGIISGLIKPSGGSIKLNGKPLEGKTGGLGYMLQKDHLFPWRTIKRNVILPLEIKKQATRENLGYAVELLKKYGLEEFIDRYPDELSGGMRQRAALIRTLAPRPELLLLDEPFSALDAQTRLSVCEDVYGIIKKEKKTSVLVTHDISEAVSVADRVILMSKRPAKVKRIYELDFPKELSPLERRESDRFRVWFELLWRDLNDG